MTAKVSKKNSFSTLSYQVLWLGSGIRPPRTIPLGPELEFIETTGRTSGLKYILHKTKSSSTQEKIKYSQLKKQEKARQKEAILRYLDEIGTINNSEARQLLKLTDNDVSYISKLFKEMLNNDDIEIASTVGNNKNVYRRKQ